ncbi:MAG TPA: hypothetical protein VF395_20395, partial [Polyangiaceae bacterium]
NIAHDRHVKLATFEPINAASQITEEALAVVLPQADRTAMHAPVRDQISADFVDDRRVLRRVQLTPRHATKLLPFVPEQLASLGIDRDELRRIEIGDEDRVGRAFRQRIESVLEIRRGHR